MSPQATAVMKEAMARSGTESYQKELVIHAHVERPPRPAKASELLALQRRINKPRGHYYLLPDITK